jgi:mono/diheme cytochrome c family protein
MKIIVTIILTAAAILLASLLYIESGSYDVSQLTHHNKITQWIINTTRQHSIEKRSKGIKVPDLSDTTMIAEGFVNYNKMCAGCHGAPGKEQRGTVKGWYPDPPRMYEFKEELKPAETFWIIKNGIKMTAMPAYGPTISDDKIWDITAFVTKKLQHISPGEYHEWEMRYGNKEKE